MILSRCAVCGRRQQHTRALAPARAYGGYLNYGRSPSKLVLHRKLQGHCSTPYCGEVSSLSFLVLTTSDVSQPLVSLSLFPLTISGTGARKQASNGDFRQEKVQKC